MTVGGRELFMCLGFQLPYFKIILSKWVPKISFWSDILGPYSGTLQPSHANRLAKIFFPPFCLRERESMG